MNTETADNIEVTLERRDSSDYGSDFTLEEESLLSELLHGRPELDNPIHESDAQLRDLNEDEVPSKIKVPRRFLGSDDPPPSSFPEASDRIPFEVHRHKEQITKTGTFHQSLLNAPLTDF